MDDNEVFKHVDAMFNKLSAEGATAKQAVIHTASHIITMCASLEEIGQMHHFLTEALRLRATQLLRTEAVQPSPCPDLN